MTTLDYQEASSEERPLLPTNIPSKRDPNETTAPISGNASSEHTGYSLWVSVCFALNYSIGAGYITNMYVVDAIIRAEAITTLISKPKYSVESISKHQIISDGQSIQKTLKNKVSPSEIQSCYTIHRNEYQLSELVGIFLGKWWRLAYDLSFGISTLIGLWSYNVLFGVSLARNIGISVISESCNMEDSNVSTDCRALYSVYIVIFWVWTVVITLIDFKHQQWLQVTATVARIVIIFLMVFTCIGLMYSVWYYDGQTYIIDPSHSFIADSSAWQWSGIAYIVAVAAFAFGSQFCVMDVIDPLSVENKQHKQHLLWASSIAICVIVYVLCGVVISLFFGANTQSPCTLGWQGFMGFPATNIQPIWAVISSWCIILLPAIDIGSAFPLIATTLANTFEAIIMSVMSRNKGKENEEQMRDVESCYQSCYNQRVSVFIKISLCTLVSGLALIEWNFELILALSGACKLLAVYVAPCFLEWKSKQFMNEICVEGAENVQVEKTTNSKDWISHISWLFIITAVSLIAFVAVFVYTILEYV